MNPMDNVKALTFDAFGTILDLAGSLSPHIKRFLDTKKSDFAVDRFWGMLRQRQRIEQYQDTILGLGHSGYLETVEKAFRYVARTVDLSPSDGETKTFMEGWQELSPFPECDAALDRLRARYRLVILSNGNPWFLDHLVKNRIRFDFDDVISVETAGAFKPHPGVYRSAARILRLEVGELLMVSANAFDVTGGRTCGLRGAYVNRYRLPEEETDDIYKPDLIVADFTELADALVAE
jgi:2-haloacid dehalogenase